MAARHYDRRASRSKHFPSGDTRFGAVEWRDSNAGDRCACTVQRQSERRER